MLPSCQKRRENANTEYIFRKHPFHLRYIVTAHQETHVAVLCTLLQVLHHLWYRCIQAVWHFPTVSEVVCTTYMYADDSNAAAVGTSSVSSQRIYKIGGALTPDLADTISVKRNALLLKLLLGKAVWTECNVRIQYQPWRILLHEVGTDGSFLVQVARRRILLMLSCPKVAKPFTQWPNHRNIIWLQVLVRLAWCLRRPRHAHWQPHKLVNAHDILYVDA